MFTGIITHIGTVTAIDKTGDWRFTIAVQDFTYNLALGASIACSGCCLTAIAWDEDSFTVQVSQETLDCTTLGTWKPGTRLNLERALKVGDELGGHFVSGHVDGLATLESVTPRAESQEWWLSVPAGHSDLPAGMKQASPVKQASQGMGAFTALARPGLGQFIAAKGSVTLDGVSLTVNKTDGNRFCINLIPHTQLETTFADRKTGDRLNLEVDLIARYLMRQKEC